MDRFHRYYKLHQILSVRRLPVARTVLEKELECSRATVKRVIEDLRNYSAPIEYDRERNGYFYDRSVTFELPGIWFNASELHAILTAQQLLAKAEPGLLAETFAPLRHKIDRILSAEHIGSGELAGRVRILRMAGRGAGPCFQTVAAALLQRKRVVIEYHARSSDATTRREVSPQRLTHYRDNWYLDAYCHARRALRSFALERILGAKPGGRVAVDVAERKLDQHFASAYGIFSGAPKEVAVLRFGAERSRWVAEEQWHPLQQGRFRKDGRYELRIPYSDSRELVMDILKHGQYVEVLAPESLRATVAAALKHALRQYAVSSDDKASRSPA